MDEGRSDDERGEDHRTVLLMPGEEEEV